LLALGLTFDAWQLSLQPSPELQRDVAPVVPLGLETLVRLRLRSADKRKRNVDINDLHPGGWAVRGLPHRVRLTPREDYAFEYALMPDMRGLPPSMVATCGSGRHGVCGRSAERWTSRTSYACTPILHRSLKWPD
jgi:hypothetical protein